MKKSKKGMSTSRSLSTGSVVLYQEHNEDGTFVLRKVKLPDNTVIHFDNVKGYIDLTRCQGFVGHDLQAYL